MLPKKRGMFEEYCMNVKSSMNGLTAEFYSSYEKLAN